MANWTPEQLRAIESRGNNLLVAAGAGAGKTAVLVERILSLVTSETKPLDIDRLLVVTFTNAAATEMRERIGASLTKLLLHRPDDEHLTRQVLLLGKASIMTLHSFCLDVLKQYFYLLELDPAFRIADENEAQLIEEEVVEIVLEKHYADPSEPFMSLIEGFSRKHDDKEIRDLILRLAHYAVSNPEPDNWLESLTAGYRDDDQQSFLAAYYSELIRHVVLELDGAALNLSRAVQIAQLEGGPTHYLERLQEDLANIEAARRTADQGWDSLRQGISNIVFGRLPSKRGVDEELRDMCKGLRDRAKGTIIKQLPPILYQSESGFSDGIVAASPIVECLIELTAEFRRGYERVKREKGLLDFSDLEQLCLKLLLAKDGSSSPIAEELSRKYTEVLTDEYQDINGVQEKIIQSLARGDNMFMVGDVKQSIYRFRLADPSLFLRKYREYRTRLGGEAIDLAANFRSRSHILEAVNFVFRRIMTSGVGEMDYDDNAALKPGALFPDDEQCPLPGVELRVLESGAQTIDDDEPSDVASREAQCIAGQISKLVSTGENVVYDRLINGYRPMTYRDIVVLLRATRNWSETFVDEFRKLDVPAYADTATGYFTATEVATMLCLLRIIDNPEQDIPLAAVLRSPLVGLTGTELAEIRLQSQHVSFYKALWVSATTVTEIGEKVLPFLKKLAKWRKLVRRGSLPELIWQVYRDTGYYVFVGATPGGAQRQANLRALYDRACQYEKTSFRGLFRFLRFIERLQENDGDLGSAKTLNEGEDVVRIMSVHKSKGLEFPVVFVAGLGRQFNMSDLNRPVLIHKILGLGPFAVDLDSRQRYPTLPRLAVGRRLRREALAEEMRVLYVAMTRAKERLYLVGSVNRRENALAEWDELSGAWVGGSPLPESTLSSARTPLDWIGPAVVPFADRDRAEGGKALFLVSKADCFSGKNIISPPTQESAGFAEPDLAHVPDGLISEQLRWRYPDLAETGLAAKVTVSELKGRIVNPDEVTAYDIFPELTFREQVAGDSPGGAELGNAVHAILQQADFKRAHDIGYLEELKLQMVRRDLLQPSLAESVDLSVVASLFHRPLGLRLAAAERLWRETPFSVLLPASQVYPGCAVQEQVMVQGIIDCLFKTTEGLILLDFKTDRSLLRLHTYREQLKFYREAVERLFGSVVDEVYLSFITLERDLKIWPEHIDETGETTNHD